MTKLSLTSSLVDLSRHMCLPRLHFRANLWPRLCLAGETTQCPSRTRRHRSQGKCQESSCIFLFFLFFFAFSFVDWTLKYAELLLDASQLPHRLRRCSQSRSGAWAGTYGWGESIDRSPWSCPTASERWENNNGTHRFGTHAIFNQKRVHFMKLSQFVEIRSPCQVCTVFLKNQSWDHSFGPDFWTVSFYRMLAWRWINSEEAGSDVCASRPPAFLSWWTVSSTWASPIMKRSEEITNYPLGCTNHDVYILDCIVIALASCQWCMRYSMMETSVRFLTPKQKWQDVAMERGVFTFSSIIASIYIYIYTPRVYIGPK